MPRPAGFLRVWHRELRRIGARPRLIFMLGPFPLALMLLLSTVFSGGLPTDLPIAVVDNDGSTLSRQAVRMVNATRDVEVTRHLTTLAEGKDAIVRGDVYAVVLLPENMERDLLSGQRPEVVTFYNNQLLTIGGIVSRTTQGALVAFSAGASAQVLISRGVLPEDAVDAVVPVPVQQSPLFNPGLDYVQFLLAALMPAVLQIFICASAALSLSRDVQSPHGPRRLVLLAGSPLRALAGKLAPYALAYMLTLIFADAVMFGFYGSPFRGSVALHAVNNCGFVLACLCLGSFLAMFSRETIAALGLTGILTAPAFGFAGISFPRITMNTFAFGWGGLLPLVPYLQLRTDQVLRGAPIDVSLPPLVWLTCQTIGYGALALFLMRRASTAQAPEIEATA